MRIVRQTVGEIGALHDADRLSTGGEGVRVLLVWWVAGQVSSQWPPETRRQHKKDKNDEG